MRRKIDLGRGFGSGLAIRFGARIGYHCFGRYTHAYALRKRNIT